MPTPPTIVPVTEITQAKRKPGRPRVVRPAPDADEYEYVEQVSAERDRAIDSDPLRRTLTTADRPDTLDVLWTVAEGVAVESAALLWDRDHSEANGGDAQKIASRRVEALGRIASLLLEGRKLGLFGQDLAGASMQRVQRLWVEIIAGVAAETLPEDVAQVFVERLGTAMAGWVDRVDP